MQNQDLLKRLSSKTFCFACLLLSKMTSLVTWMVTWMQSKFQNHYHHHNYYHDSFPRAFPKEQTLEMLVFRKILRTYWMDAPLVILISCIIASYIFQKILHLPITANTSVYYLTRVQESYYYIHGENKTLR